MSGTTIVIGPDDGDSQRFASALGARLVPAPAFADEEGWRAWRDALVSEPKASGVVVSLPAARQEPAAISTLALEGWMARGEAPLLGWMTALGGAAPLCADGGAIVAVVDGPPPLDSAGLAPEAAVAEGVVALVRSLALSEGRRGVRANTVTTPSRLLSGPPIAPDPPLAGFPGTIEEDVLAAVRLLLSADAAYLSGHCLPADRGRSW